MTDARVPTRRAARNAAPRPRRATPVRSRDDDALAALVRRGPDCAFANIRMLGRVVGTFYDEMLKPADVRASQLALMWAIIACEPVEQKALETITRTDQTTLSRTVENLRNAGLVLVGPGSDRRVRLIRLSPRGRRAFVRAMPYWEQAQAELARFLSLQDLRGLARAARRFAARRDP
jgi:DNA-binding MarR family transcriptional regulator